MSCLEWLFFGGPFDWSLMYSENMKACLMFANVTAVLRKARFAGIRGAAFFFLLPFFVFPFLCSSDPDTHRRGMETGVGEWGEILHYLTIICRLKWRGRRLLSLK